MGAWSEAELRRIDAVQELQIAPVRRNSELRRALPIWAVRAGDELYARAAYGPSTGWHRVARASGRAQIVAGGPSIRTKTHTIIRMIAYLYRRDLRHSADRTEARRAARRA